MADPQKILVLAPHTDDGELGCGGSIAKFCAENKEVYYAAFSPCRKSLPAGWPADTLEKECRAAVRELGIDPARVILFDFEVREFPQQRQAILEELVKLDKKIQPGLVFIPAATDLHQDHQVIHSEALRAFRNRSLLGYELPWNQRSFEATYFIRLTAGQIAKKAAALRLYASQAHRNYMQEDFSLALARVRGVQCNSEYAEAFEVYKLLG